MKHEFIGCLTETETSGDRFGCQEASFVVALDTPDRDNASTRTIGSLAPELIGKRVRITIEPAEAGDAAR